MKIRTVTLRKQGLLIAGALAVLSQSALGSDANVAKREPEVLTVTAQRPPIVASDSQIETDVSVHIEAVERRFAKDLEKDLAAIGNSKIELVISEVPTRG
jgi:hypothetical protein